MKLASMQPGTLSSHSQCPLASKAFFSQFLKNILLKLDITNFIVNSFLWTECFFNYVISLRY